jgi:hypothetical protein
MSLPFHRMVGGLLLLAILAFGCARAQAEDPNADIYGTWKIKTFAGSAESFGLTDKQIRALIGKPVLISAEKFVFNGRTCLHPNYQRSTEETKTYFLREWRADLSELPLPNPVTIIETGCNMVYPINMNHIIVAEDSGVFFEAVRVRSAASKSTSAGRR